MLKVKNKPIKKITDDYSGKHDSDKSAKELDKDLKAIGKDKIALSKIIHELKTKKTEINKLINKNKKSIAEESSLLKGLWEISESHGSNATIRLKNSRFKYAHPSNFFKKIFNAGRYQTESEAAAERINALRGKVHAGEAIKTLETKISGPLNDINELRKQDSALDSEINELNGKIYKLSHEMSKIHEDGAEVFAAEKERMKVWQEFSLLYQSEVGFKAINAEARHQFGSTGSAGKVNAKDVIAEYRHVHGDNIFDKGNKEILNTISRLCKDLRVLVKTTAEGWYTPSVKKRITYRGQGMTKNGIDQLKLRYYAEKDNKAKTIYKCGQFFSTSFDENVAINFAKKSRDNVKVLFTVIGYNGNGISVTSGLQFVNDEREILYSPLTNFKVTSISESSPDNIHRITLQEVTKAGSTMPLPY